MKKIGVFCDVAGLSLTAEDRDIIAHPAVLGIILFARNYENVRQLYLLCHAIKKIKPSIWIAVDQEGGRVQRFAGEFPVLPAMQIYGERYLKKPVATVDEFTRAIRMQAALLAKVGVNLNLVPVLDLRQLDNNVVSDRSFARDHRVVIDLARIMITVYHQLGIRVVGKHFPGHGAVHADSHYALPYDERTFAELNSNDLLPFRLLAHELDFIMPAHVVYTACDPNPATFSAFWLQTVLRQLLKFQGKIISDDLSMMAARYLAPDIQNRTHKAFDAGCDIITICNDRESVIQLLNHL